MVQQSAPAQPADPRIDSPIHNGEICNGAINDVAINGMTATTKAILAFALVIAQMSRQSLDRTTRHIEKLRRVHSPEEVTSIQLDFVKESLEHAAHHTRKVCEMLTDFPLEIVKTCQDDWLQSINAAVQANEAAEHAPAQRAVARMFPFTG